MNHVFVSEQNIKITMGQKNQQRMVSSLSIILYNSIRPSWITKPWGHICTMHPLLSLNMVSIDPVVTISHSSSAWGMVSLPPQPPADLSSGCQREPWTWGHSEVRSPPISLVSPPPQPHAPCASVSVAPAGPLLPSSSICCAVPAGVSEQPFPLATLASLFSLNQSLYYGQEYS